MITLHRSKNLAYVFVLVGSCLDNLNVAAAFTMSQSLQKQLDASSSQATWVVSSYALTLGSFIIVFGKLGDVCGLHKVFLAGLFAMALLSLICAVIQHNIVPLIVFRALKGIAGAAVLPNAIGICGNYFQGPQLTRAIKLLMLATCGALGLGTILGGAFSQTNIGYRAFFYFSFALSLTTAVALCFVVVPVERTANHDLLSARYLNYGGAILLAGGLMMIIAGLTEAGSSWRSPKVYVTIPVGFVVVLAVFLFESVLVKKYQSRKIEKTSYLSRLVVLFPPEVAQITNFVPFVAGLFLNNAGFTATITALLLYHEFVDENDAVLAAAKVFCIAAGIVVGAVVYSQKAADRLGNKTLLVVSACVDLGSAVWVTRIDPNNKNSFWEFEFAPLLLYGWAINLFFQTFYHAMLSQTPLHLQGNVTGIFQTVGQIGLCVGTAVASSIIGALDTASPPARELVHSRCVNALWFNVACFAAELVLMLASKNS